MIKIIGKVLVTFLSVSLVFCVSSSVNLLFAQEVSHEPGQYKFLKNKGQWYDKIHYRATVSAGHIWLEKEGILYQFNNYNEFHHAGLDPKKDSDPQILQQLLFAQFVDGNLEHGIQENIESSEYYNFFLGNDKDRWATNVRGYSEIIYSDIYEGIDLKIFEEDDALKYEYTVEPNANPEHIKIKFYGHEKIKINASGELVVQTKLGEIIEQKPFVYQIKNGRIIEVESKYVLDNDIMSYSLGHYDKDLNLIIDPVLIFATYSGSPSDNFGMTGTYAYNGDGYSGGTIYGNSYPVPLGIAWNTISNFNSLQGPNYGITDVFISKYSSDGTQMLWTNFLGGGNESSGTETVHSLICDTLNNIYCYGATSSVDFPTQNAFQASHAGGLPGGNFLQNGVYYTNQGTDIWVSKISSDGMTLIGSTYIGGSSNDGINYNVTSYANNYNNISWYDSLTANYGDQFRGEIMLDSLNNVYIASSSRSTDFPTLNSFQLSNAGQQDGVLFKLSADFSSLLWSTYFGGSENDACYSVKIDSSYNIIIAGGTSSTNLQGTTGGLYSSYQGGATDGYVAKISSDGGTLIQTTYYGTSGYDQAYFAEIDRWDNIFIYGQTNGNIPIINAAYSNPNSGQFITKLTPNLNAVDYSTRIGNGDGNPDISPSAFLVDVCGNVYISGWGANILQSTGLNGMPTTTDALQPTNGDGFNFYLFVLERDAQSMLYGSYLGGGISHEHVDGGTSRFDKFGVIYQSVCGGCWGNSDFPTSSGAWSSQNLDVAGGTNIQSGCNNLLFKFDFEIVPIADFQISDVEGCAPFTFILDNESNDTINSVWTFPTEAIILQGGINPEIIFDTPGTYEIYLSITDTICNLVDTAMKVVNVYESLDGLITSNDTLICDAGPVNLWASAYGTATSYIWSDQPNFTNQLNSGPMDSTISVSPAFTTTYYVTVSNGWPLCDLIDSVVVEVSDGPVADFLLSDIEGCVPFTVVLDNESSDTSASIWHLPPGAVVITGGVNPEVEFLIPGNYEVLLTLYDPVCNLTDSAIQTIIVHEGIQLSVPNDTVLCTFPTFDLVANSFGTATSFIWSDDPNFSSQLNSDPMDSVITISPVVSTTYYVTVSNGWTVCDLVDSVQVLFVDDAIDLSSGDVICRGDTTVVRATTSLPPGQINYQWSPSSVIILDADSMVFVAPQSSMWIYLIWTTSSGCVVKDSTWIEVEYLNPESVYAVADPAFVGEGYNTTLMAYPSGSQYSYQWYPAFSVNNPNDQITTATVNSDFTYVVEVTKGPCKLPAIVFVETYEFICGGIYIYVPNAFSPNGDGENDKVFVRGQNLEKIEFKIFDRWGEKVFESNDQAVGWDGTFKGELLDPDVYVYHLTAVCVDGQETLIKGNITLLR
ncbi:MAG: gliding motility-associated C-terminal domain-containing protein [Crocinitomicaceae bacterium]